MLTRPRQIGLTKEEVEAGTPMLDTRERIEHVASKAKEKAKEEAHEERSHEEGDDEQPYQPLSIGTPISSDAPPPPSARAEANEADDEEILLLDELVAETAPSTPARELDAEASAPRREEPEPTATGTASTEPLSVRLARLETQLYQSRNRDEVITLALEIASTFCASAALFVVRGDSVSLFRSSDGGRSASGGEELVIPTNSPSLFTHPAQTGLPFRGQPPQGGVDGRVLDGLGRDAVQEILVHPVIIRDRVVNLLYADNGPEIFGETSIGALTALSHTLAGAYERLIADHRRQRRG